MEVRGPLAVACLLDGRQEGLVKLSHGNARLQDLKGVLAGLSGDFVYICPFRTRFAYGKGLIELGDISSYLASGWSCLTSSL